MLQQQHGTSNTYLAAHINKRVASITDNNDAEPRNAPFVLQQARNVHLNASLRERYAHTVCRSVRLLVERHVQRDTPLRKETHNVSYIYTTQAHIERRMRRTLHRADALIPSNRTDSALAVFACARRPLPPSPPSPCRLRGSGSAAEKLHECRT